MRNFRMHHLKMPRFQTKFSKCGFHLSLEIIRNLHYFLGDSGGPLYQWFDSDKKGKRAAYIIGTVARGYGCANHNSPGIFTRITGHLDWIKENTKSGNCFL